MSKATLRVLGFLSVACWAGLLFAPAYQTAHPYVGNPNDPWIAHGSDCLLLGWGLPLDLLQPTGIRPRNYHNPLPEVILPSLVWAAWWANPPWIWNVLLALRGRAPGVVLSILATGLAMLALQPFYSSFGDDHGVNGDAVPLWGAYAWAGLMVLMMLIALGAKAFDANGEHRAPALTS